MAGNAAVGGLLHRSEILVQRSALSDDLQETYLAQGRDAFFRQLRSVRVSDPDVVTFVDSLSAEDREIAYSIMGRTQFDQATRSAILSELVLRLAYAQADFDRAVTMVEEDVRAEQQAGAELANLLVSVAFSFVVPGIGGAITSLANRLPIAATHAAYRAALLAQDQAPNIAAALGEVGKAAAKSVIDRQLAENPRGFFNALREGLQQGNAEVFNHIRSNIATIPDYSLLIYLANWDVTEVSADRYAVTLRQRWNQYKSQVLAVGDYDYAVINAFADITLSSNLRLVRVPHDGSSQLAIVKERTLSSGPRMTTSMHWRTAVGPEYADMAIERARRVQGGVRSVDASEIEGVPSSYR